jgi:pSer/pThr/pTyr-binding forkhead associated (FHA) protein
MAPEQALAARMSSHAAQQVAIVLEPISHPQLESIRIDDGPFAIGRAEPPFAAYPPEIVADLSRRHARIFIEGGEAWLADLGSKNGTTVNGVPVAQAVVRLRDGDALGLAGVLAYRVKLQVVDAGPAPPARLASLTLEPANPALGLQTIVLTRFPFLISKVDEAFARYRDAQPEQVGYLSRRHAHIFLKGGLPYVEDLGSTNGSFIGAVRLDEHAHELEDGDLLGFGGHHFVYRVSLQWEQTAPEPTLTRVGRTGAGAGAGAAAAGADGDKTTFVAAAGSFLDIFCVDPAAESEEAAHAAHEPAQGPTEAAGGSGQAPARAGRGGRFALMAAALLEALGGAGEASQARLRRWLLGVGVAALLIALTVFRAGAPVRELQGLAARGDYERAAMLAAERLARDPADAEIRALGTEALLKANLPRWIASIGQRRFDLAARELARMRAASRDNADARPLVAEIAWVGALEQFVAERGGPDVPVRGAADGARIRQLLKGWQDEQQAHQRASATISSYVPGFRDTYARAVSDLRKLALSGGGGGNEQ